MVCKIQVTEIGTFENTNDMFNNSWKLYNNSDFGVISKQNAIIIG